MCDGGKGVQHNLTRMVQNEVKLDEVQHDDERWPLAGSRSGMNVRLGLGKQKQNVQYARTNTFEHVLVKNVRVYQTVCTFAHGQYQTNYQV